MFSFFKTNWWKLLMLIFWGYFFILMVEITLKYIPLSSDASFLAIKQDEVIAVPYYLPIFYIHVYSSIFVLFFGIFQFIKISNKQIRKLHQLSGKLYFYITVLLAAPSGLFIGFYANGGIISKMAFVLLGSLWLYFTLVGVSKIKQKNINAHKFFMMRSYALALSALTLRAWKVIIVYFFHPAPMDVYQIIAWLGFVPNLMLVEWYNSKKSKPLNI